MVSEFDIVICTISSPLETRIVNYLPILSVSPVNSIVIVVNGDQKCRESWAATNDRLPEKVKVVYSEPYSLSRARNTGFYESDSEWVVFIDDDVEPDESLAQKLARALAAAESNVAIIGGRVLLSCSEKIPNAARVWLSELDFGVESRILDQEFVNGALFSIRRKVLSDLGGFHPSLGRQAGILLSGEESLLIWQVRECGLKVAYCGEALVTQHVDASRLSLAFLSRRIFWEQVTQSTIRSLMGWRISGFPVRSERKASSIQIVFLSMFARLLKYFLG